jgi:predicted Zn-dependent protease
MIGPDAIRRITDRVLTASPADQTEVVVIAGEEQLTRFANNEIHQHVSETNAEIRIRAIIGQQIGVAATNDPSEAGLQRALDAAVAIAQHQPPNPQFTSLPTPQPITPADGWSQATADCMPQRRAEDVGTIIRLAEAQGLVAAGAFSTKTEEIAVANSLGVWAYHPGTHALINTVVMGEASGWAAAASRDISEIDVEAIGREACDKAVRSRNPQPLAPGAYPVVLESYAVAELLTYLNLIGFGALALQEGRSPLELGQQQAAPNITVYDDGTDPTGLPMPFDYEGVPKQLVPLIKNGVSAGIVYDTQTAAKDRQHSTGHALAAPNTYGPIALNLFIKPGGTPKAELVKGIERGVYVTRFWYVNIVHPKQSLLTGMTRDGTFLIENGEIVGPINNLRFTQSVLEALRNVQDISRETLLHRDFLGATYRTPALKIATFNFSSATEF